MKIIKYLLLWCLRIIIVGVIATICMDLWNFVLYLTFGITLDWHILGRWIGHTLQGDFMLYGVNQSAAVAHEAALGWAGHYLTGLMYAGTYLIICRILLHHRPTLLVALIISWCFMVMPFLLYQPAVGVGYFSMEAGNPNFVRLITFTMHTFFGIGLYLGFLLSIKLMGDLRSAPKNLAHKTEEQQHKQP